MYLPARLSCKQRRFEVVEVVDVSEGVSSNKQCSAVTLW